MVPRYTRRRRRQYLEGREADHTQSLGYSAAIFDSKCKYVTKDGTKDAIECNIIWRHAKTAALFVHECMYCAAFSGKLFLFRVSTLFPSNVLASCAQRSRKFNYNDFYFALVRCAWRHSLLYTFALTKTVAADYVIQKHTYEYLINLKCQRMNKTCIGI